MLTDEQIAELERLNYEGTFRWKRTDGGIASGEHVVCDDPSMIDRDADLVVAARNALPSLLAEVRSSRRPPPEMEEIEKAARRVLATDIGSEWAGTGTPEEAAVDALRRAISASQAPEPREQVIRSLYAACPFTPGEGCRQCRVCDAAAQVAALAPPSSASPPPETRGATSDCAAREPGFPAAWCHRPIGHPGNHEYVFSTTCGPYRAPSPPSSAPPGTDAATPTDEET